MGNGWYITHTCTVPWSLLLRLTVRAAVFYTADDAGMGCLRLTVDRNYGFSFSKDISPAGVGHRLPSRMVCNRVVPSPLPFLSCVLHPHPHLREQLSPNRERLVVSDAAAMQMLIFNRSVETGALRLQQRLDLPGSPDNLEIDLYRGGCLCAFSLHGTPSQVPTRSLRVSLFVGVSPNNKPSRAGVSPNDNPSRAQVESFRRLDLWTGPCKLLYGSTKGSFEISACARESPNGSGEQSSL